MNVIVTGAGGALGGHLVRRLLDDGNQVQAVDVKAFERWWQLDDRAENVRSDLALKRECTKLFDERPRVDRVYNLAANMGGIGFITEEEAACAFTVLTTAHMIQASAQAEVGRYVQTSSACVYPTDLQEHTLVSLHEDDAWPALPDHGYGLEKLFGEKLCEYARKDWGLETRVARLHNVYGTNGEWRGGREKAPAAICRKVARAKLLGQNHIDIWGDGEQTRSFMWVGDFVEGILRIGESDYHQPLNLGTSEMVTINELVTLVEGVAGVELERRYELTAPQGVRGRNSDNRRIREVLGWEPSTKLREGLEKLYPWVEDQVRKEIA